LWSIYYQKKISKFDATRCQFLRIECTKFDFRDPAQGAYSALPGPLSVFKGLLLRGGKGKMEGKGRETEGGRGGEKGRDGSGMASPSNILA